VLYVCLYPLHVCHKPLAALPFVFLLALACLAKRRAIVAALMVRAWYYLVTIHPSNLRVFGKDLIRNYGPKLLGRIFPSLAILQ